MSLRAFGNVFLMPARVHEDTLRLRLQAGTEVVQRFCLTVSLYASSREPNRSSPTPRFARKA